MNFLLYEISNSYKLNRFASGLKSVILLSSIFKYYKYGKLLIPEIFDILLLSRSKNINYLRLFSGLMFSIKLSDNNRYYKFLNDSNPDNSTI